MGKEAINDYQKGRKKNGRNLQVQEFLLIHSADRWTGKKGTQT
jgi:hypothetical protein